MEQALFDLTIAPATPRNSRNSEGAIIQLQNGDLLLGWTEFYGGSGADHAPARLVGRISNDGGRTWGEKYTLIENDGGCNVMEVNFLRLRNGGIALFYCQKNSELTDCRVMVRVSADEGRTFGTARQLSPPGEYTGLTNGRSLRLRSGRILVEAWGGGVGTWGDGNSYCIISDDDGATWRDGQRIRPADGECWEPIAIELRDGRVMMLLRTRLGGQYASFSEDGGESWSTPVPTALTGSAAPAAITRIPGTGELLAIWNHNAPDATRRNPLTAAVSVDEGETWENVRNIEESPDDAWAYPAVTWVEDTALVTYFTYKGGHSLKLKALSASWFRM